MLESAFLKKVISTFTGFLWVDEACLPSWPWVVRAGQNRQPERKKCKIERDYARGRERERSGRGCSDRMNVKAKNTMQCDEFQLTTVGTEHNRNDSDKVNDVEFLSRE